MPGAGECVILQGKRDLIDVIKDLEMGKLSWITYEPSVITNTLVFLLILT